ncbi:MAG: response regulator transcription factor [Acidimicrobiales bacterium]|nr:response regulator transcription factor [Acidimicrobiales bacterium]
MKRILVVADVPELRRDIVSAISDPDREIVELQSGRMVRESVFEESPSLVILDSQIGSMGAFAVTQDLHLDEFDGTQGHIPVLILLDRRADAWQARNFGAEGFIVKPLDPIRIRKAVREILAGKTWFDPTYAPEPHVALAPGAQALPGLAGVAN